MQVTNAGAHALTRTRNKNGRFRQKRADTRLDTLRETYGNISDRRGDCQLGTIREATGKSLSRLVHGEHEITHAARQSMQNTTLSALSAVSSPAATTAAHVILTYDFGNQIDRSKLQVYDDGTVEHVEHVCCPPTDNSVAEAPLSPSQLATLKSSIDVAAQGAQKSEPSVVSMGSPSGLLHVVTSDGQEVNVREIDRDLNTGTLTYNTSPEAKKILSFVNQYASVQFPSA